MRMYKTLIASDRTVVRGHIRSVCDDYGLRICGEANSLEDALRLSQAYRPDIVIFDFHRRLRDQTLIISSICGLGPIKVLIYSSSAPTRATKAYIRAGASGFIDKNNSTELLTIIQGMIAGFTVVPFQALKQERVKLAHRPDSSGLFRASDEPVLDDILPPDCCPPLPIQEMGKQKPAVDPFGRTLRAQSKPNQG